MLNNINSIEIGSVVSVKDKILDNMYTIATVKAKELDEDGFIWLYLRANDEALNTNTDQRFPFTYWKVLEINSPNLSELKEEV